MWMNSEFQSDNIKKSWRSRAIAIDPYYRKNSMAHKGSIINNVLSSYIDETEASVGIFSKIRQMNIVKGINFD